MQRRQAAGSAARPGDSARADATPAPADPTIWTIQATRHDRPSACVRSIRRILAALLCRRLQKRVQPQGGK
jgi:hypothetical protein